MKKTIAALAASVALAATLAACSGNTVEAPAPAPSQSQAQPAAPTQGTSSAFGGAVTFPGGVKVSVSKPELVPGGQYAYGAVEGKITTFTITVTNGSDQPINGGLMGFPQVTYGAKGTKASNANNESIGANFLSTILPGETQSAKVGYGVPPAELATVRVEVMGPNIADLPAVFKEG